MNSNEPSASSSAAAPPFPSERFCANCGAAAPGEYCPACGQETRGPPTSAEFLRETIAHFLSLESKAWRTISKLVLAPGALTVEYLAGRRARYVRPVRLYLWISVLTIAFVESFGLHVGLRFLGDEGIYLFEPSQGAPAEAQKPHVNELRPMRFILEHFDTPGVRRFKAMSGEEQIRFMQEQRHRSVQYFMLFLVPVYALILRFCYWNRRRRYAEHLVFCLHAQSFLLVMLLIEAKLPAVLAMVVSLWVIAYFFVAVKRVYGGAWADALSRGAAAMALNITTFLVSGALLIYALLERYPASG